MNSGPEIDPRCGDMIMPWAILTASPWQPFTYITFDPAVSSFNSPLFPRYQSHARITYLFLYPWCHGNCYYCVVVHDDVIKWKHFPRNWPFVREIHRSPVNFPHKGQWRGALMFSLIYAWINDWVNNREAGDLRRQHGHYDVIVMMYSVWPVLPW